MAKKAILVEVDESDKERIKEAAYRSRVSMATWCRNVIVMEAIAQSKGDRP